jgi:hypothetical protein
MLLAFVSMAIYAILNNGLKIYKRVIQDVPQEQLAIFFDKFSYDVRNAIVFSDLVFSGTYDGFETAAFVNSPTLRITSPGKVGYFFDRGSGVIYRQQRDISQLYLKEEGRTVVMLSNVKDARFSYYFYDKEIKDYVWDYTWAGQELPRAVRLEIQWDDGRQVSEFTRTVSIPVSE